MAAHADDIGYGRQVLRDAGGELVTASVYLLAWLFSPWVSDEMLVALVAAVALQFFVLTPLLGVVTPRGFGGISLFLLGHGLLFALMAWIASEGGLHAPDWWAVALIQAPLVLRNLSRLSRPPDAPVHAVLEALGPFLLVIPMAVAAIVLSAVLPDLGLAGREIRFQKQPPLTAHELKFGLMAGFAYFAGYALARTALERLGGEMHRRGGLSPETIRRWREDYRRSRRR